MKNQTFILSTPLLTPFLLLEIGMTLYFEEKKTELIHQSFKQIFSFGNALSLFIWLGKHLHFMMH